MPSRMGTSRKVGPRMRSGSFFSKPKFPSSIRRGRGYAYVSRSNPVKRQRTFNKAIKRYAPRNSPAYRRARAITRRNKTMLNALRQTGFMPSSASRSFVGF